MLVVILRRRCAARTRLAAHVVAIASAAAGHAVYGRCDGNDVAQCVKHVTIRLSMIDCVVGQREKDQGSDDEHVNRRYGAGEGAGQERTPRVARSSQREGDHKRLDLGQSELCGDDGSLR